MVKQATATKKVSPKKSVKKTVKKSSANKTKRTTKAAKVAFYPNLVTFLVSTAAVMILFSLALFVTI